MRYPINIQPLRRLLSGELEAVEFYKTLIRRFSDSPDIGTLFYVTNNHKKAVSYLAGLVEKYEPRLELKSLMSSKGMQREIKNSLSHPETVSVLSEVENTKLWVLNQNFLDPVMAAEWRKVLMDKVVPLLKSNQTAIQQLAGRSAETAEPLVSA